MIRIGIFGEYNSGKSLLINCILRRPVATVGNRTATTHTMVHYLFSEKESVRYSDGEGPHRLEVAELDGIDTREDVSEVCVYLHNDILKNCSLVDMPGIGFDEDDDKTALAALRGVDYAILLVSNFKELRPGSLSYDHFRVLQKLKIPYYFVLNCSYSYSGKWDPSDEVNALIAQNDYGVLGSYPPLRYPFGEDTIPIVNLMWYWLSLRGRDDKLVRKYSPQLRADGLFDEDVTESAIREASQFHYIETLFGMDNQLYLTLKKEFKEEMRNLREELCPIGTIQAFAYRQIPPGWLPCDGSEVGIAGYPDLYDHIGCTFGGDGVTTFRVPDLRGRFIRGWDEDGMVDCGERAFGSAQEDAIQNHIHVIPSQETKEGGDHSHRVFYKQHSIVETSLIGLYSTAETIPRNHGEKDPLGGNPGTDKSGDHTHVIPESKTGEPLADEDVRISDETRPKNVALLYCIKAANQ